MRGRNSIHSLLFFIKISLLSLIQFKTRIKRIGVKGGEWDTNPRFSVVKWTKASEPEVDGPFVGKIIQRHKLHPLTRTSP